MTLTDVQDDAGGPQVDREPVEAVRVGEDLGRHVVVLPAHALRLHEPPDGPPRYVGHRGRLALVVVRDPQAHPHVDDHALVAVDKDVLKGQVSMTHSLPLQVIEALER